MLPASDGAVATVWFAPLAGKAEWRAVGSCAPSVQSTAFRTSAAATNAAIVATQVGAAAEKEKVSASQAVPTLLVPDRAVAVVCLAPPAGEAGWRAVGSHPPSVQLAAFRIDATAANPAGVITRVDAVGEKEKVSTLRAVTTQ